MNEAAKTRHAALDAVDDVEPSRLRQHIIDLLENGLMAPGALTLSCAPSEEDYQLQSTSETRAAGVQLIYEGLRLTRDLARQQPWEDPESRKEGDLEILAADVMVSRGFALLSHTPAADKAVETIQHFGRTQPRGTPPEHPDGDLEADVLELAVIAGTADTDGADSKFLDRATSLSNRFGAQFPPAEQLIAAFHERPITGSMGTPAEDLSDD